MNSLEVLQMDKSKAMKVMAESYRETVEELEKELNSFEENQCPNCHDFPVHHGKHCHVCDGKRVIYIKYGEGEL